MSKYNFTVYQCSVSEKKTGSCDFVVPNKEDEGSVGFGHLVLWFPQAFSQNTHLEYHFTFSYDLSAYKEQYERFKLSYVWPNFCLAFYFCCPKILTVMIVSF